MSGVLVQHADGRWFRLNSVETGGVHRLQTAGLPPFINLPGGPYVAASPIALSGVAPGFGTVWIVLFTGGLEQGARVSVAVSSAAWTGSLTPTVPGSYTVRMFDSSVGGALLTESTPFSVT